MKAASNACKAGKVKNCVHDKTFTPRAGATASMQIIDIETTDHCLDAASITSRSVVSSWSSAVCHADETPWTDGTRPGASDMKWIPTNHPRTYSSTDNRSAVGFLDFLIWGGYGTQDSIYIIVDFEI